MKRINYRELAKKVNEIACNVTNAPSRAAAENWALMLVKKEHALNYKQYLSLSKALHNL